MASSRLKCLAMVSSLSLVVILAFATFAAAYYAAGLFTRPPWLSHRTPEQGLISREGDPWAELHLMGAIHDPRTDLGFDYEDVEFPGAELDTWIPFMLAGQMAGVVAQQYADPGEVAPTWLSQVKLPRWWTKLITEFVRFRIGGDRDREPIDLVDKIAPRPLLLMHGDSDDMAPVEASHRLFEKAGEPKELWIVPGGEHALLYARHSERWGARVLAFLARASAAASADVLTPGAPTRR